MKRDAVVAQEHKCATVSATVVGSILSFHSPATRQSAALSLKKTAESEH